MLLETGFRRPMYKDLGEVLSLIIATAKESFRKNWSYRRTVESGTVEEFVVIQEESGARKLMFRVWPILYAHDCRIEYKPYISDPDLNSLISEHLRVCARTNGARLLLKE